MDTANTAINLKEKLAKFSAHWTPKILSSLNDCYIKVVKLEGEFVWHSHDVDELFFILEGEMIMHYRDRSVTVGPGELIVVEKGKEHKPEAKKEVHALLIEPKTVINTGDAAPSDKTCEELEWI